MSLTGPGFPLFVIYRFLSLSWNQVANQTVGDMEEEDTEGHGIIFQMRNTGNECIRELNGKGKTEVQD